MKGWRFVGWIYPGEITWARAHWLIGGTVIGDSWWRLADDDETLVESLCIFGFCFEKPIAMNQTPSWLGRGK